MQPLRILFVCTGNTCRSPIAEGVLKKLASESDIHGIEVSSCGTLAASGSTVPPIAIGVAKKRGVDLSRHSSIPISKELVQGSDLILGMEESHLERVIELSAGAKAKTFLLSEFAGKSFPLKNEVLDPAGGEENAYTECFLKIESLVKSSLELLKRMALERAGERR